MKRILITLAACMVIACANPSQAISVLIKKSATSPGVPTLLTDSATGQAGQTGLAGTAVVTVELPGTTSYVAASGTYTETGNGTYDYFPATAETASAGVLKVHITCAGCQTYDTSAQIVGFDPALGTVTAVTGAVASVTGAVGSVTSPVTVAGTVTVAGNVTVGGYAAAEDPATLVFGAAAGSYNAAGSMGQKINAAGSAGNPWTTDVSTGYTGSQAGSLLYAIRSGQPVTLPATVLGSGDHTAIQSDVQAGLTAQGLTAAIVQALAAQVARIYGAEWGSITQSGSAYTVSMPGGALTIPAPGATLGTVTPAYDTSGKPTTTTKTVN